MLSSLCPLFKPLRIALLAGAAMVAISACAATRAPASAQGYAAGQPQLGIAELTARYRANPKDKATIIHYAAALRCGAKRAGSGSARTGRRSLSQ
ncbi:hypothetical protein N8D56_00610 [Devosia sp. A8/3-2]|nr:hypothetical protein N8D56_00610 [Devosia sp. A8/3-2]